jgi:hypothetical protein
MIFMIKVIELSKPLEELILLSRQVDNFDESPKELKEWMQCVENCLKNDWQIVDDVANLQDYLSKSSYHKLFKETAEKAISSLRKYYPLLKEMVDRNFGNTSPFHSYLLTTAYSAFLKIVPLNNDGYLEHIGVFDEELFDLIYEMTKSTRKIDIAAYTEKVIEPNLKSRLH